MFSKTSTSYHLKVLSRVNLSRALIVVATLFAGVVAVVQRAHAQAYPLKVSANERYLVDQVNVPFFYHADTAWQIFSKLTKAEAEQYLEDRRSKGFNALKVQILSPAPWAVVNREGQAPFTDNDLTKPNDAYFTHVDWVVSRATQKGLLMVMSTAWFGYRGDGWRNSLNTSNARAYGRYLGKRYQNFNNIVWVHGGDDPVEGKLDPVRELAAGIKENAPQHLQTYHDNERASSETLNNEDWLDINMAYSRSVNYVQVLNEYNRQPVRPIVEGENLYADRNNSAFVVRRQAYWMMLSGAAGHAYGADPVWRFDPGWENMLNDPSAFQMEQLRNLFGSRAWYNLEPDQNHTVVTDGYGTFGGNDYVTAAYTSDGNLLIAYLPEGGSLTVDLSKLNRSVRAKWFDPTDGSYREAGSFNNSGSAQKWIDLWIMSRYRDAGSYNNSGRQSLSSPSINAGGERDWVLVMELG